MRALSPLIPRLSLLFGFILLTACGGGGGGGGVGSAGTSPQDAEPAASDARMLGFTEDIEPILQAKCTGCHNSGDNPLAPFSLEGEERVNNFKSAIDYTLQTGTMPPAGFAQLTQGEHARLTTWLAGEPYNESNETLRIPLVEALAWDIQPEVDDNLLEYRPAEVDCPRGSGWLVEEDELEIRTEFCNYLSLTQQALLELDAGTPLELAMSHSALNFNAPAEAFIALSIAGSVIWEKTIPIPSDGDILKETIALPFAVQPGDAIAVHLHNHGDNAYTLHSLEALVPGDQELTFCPSYDSTFAAIQGTVFEQAGCANSLCHSSEAAEGGLDLSPGVAFENLIGVPAQGSSLALVEPRRPSLSYLYHKLSAKTFPGSYDISGAPMPSAGGAISPGQLEAIRLWIEAGAPKEGSVGDTLGRGEDEIERLLGVCLPEAEAVNTTPLPPPAPDRGVQFAMPPHEVLAEDEREICFAVYEDFRDQIPEEYLTPSRDYFYVKNGQTREDAFTHHNLIYQPPVGIESIHDPAFGEWTCVGGDSEGELCEPTDLSSCGSGKCRAEIQDSVACRGYGPTVRSNSGILGLGSGPNREGFYGLHPSHGIFYWNSHAFNLTTEDGLHHVWRNLYFAEDRRFLARGINDLSSITAGAGTPPFGKKTVCRDYQFEQGEALLSLSSHTHKRGERFFMYIDDELVYETFDYDEPLRKTFEPAVVFNSPDPEERILTYCATWNNGVNGDGSPNIETVTRLSRRPENAFPCRPTACVAGNIGAACKGKNDDAACDSSPGAGDGWCDACIIMPGAASDDEMFILLGSKVADYDALVREYEESKASVEIVSPLAGDTFAPGDTVVIEFDFINFDLLPPEQHGHDHGDGMTHDDGMEHDEDGDHTSVTAGHYHVYLDTEDDAADHVTDYATTTELVLPADIAPGNHEIRVSLRAPDHHGIGVEDRVTIIVQ